MTGTSRPTKASRAGTSLQTEVNKAAISLLTEASKAAISLLTAGLKQTTIRKSTRARAGLRHSSALSRHSHFPRLREILLLRKK